MRTQNFVLICAIVAIALTTVGCATSGLYSSGNATEVQLQRGNFKIVARNVAGAAEAGYLFGQSFSLGITTNTIAVVRVSGTGMLYDEALANLWKNFEAANGPVEGRKLALVNVRYDSEALNLFVYTQPKIMIRADVIEFTD